MTARNYYARTHDGYRVDDPSPVALAVLIDELNHVDNTFMTVQPDRAGVGWRATVSLRRDEAYEILFRDESGRAHEVRTLTASDAVVSALTRWLAARVPDATG
ncbi:hypothetical protein ACQP1K_09940 [Sphaerimonospora sp. CA-214678]|uniref:hypothetical protein n=1 Tax=Sphaerimonospora sp. CA-214678 TaxID=3240029 RepID=UPI003D8C8022